MKEKITEGGIWNFEVDNVPEYCYWKKAFTKAECNKIISLGKKFGTKIARTRSKVSDIRKSKVLWLRCNNDTYWIYQRLAGIITDINKKFFNFDLWGMHEAIQLTHYQAPGGKYKAHVDKGYKAQVRKLSTTVQLSDPTSYKGGDLVLRSGEETKIQKEIGYVAIFPSYTLHEVTPMLKGERWSLVCWVAGPNFK
mgnify:CR=1 FL=1